MNLNLDYLTSAGHAACLAGREALAPALAAASNTSLVALRAALAGRCVTMTMLAGSGSRWVSSIEEARAAGRDTGADPAAPRGLFPVRNVMGFGPDPIPIAAYALAAVRDLGHHLIVVRGWEQEIEAGILAPLGFRPGSWTFVTQVAPGGKPRGHGDAAFQAMELWSGYDYVIVNFGGDASSPLSAFCALATIDALANILGVSAPDLVMPAALVDTPTYPIQLDDAGLPRAFGHAKLRGGSNQNDSAPGPQSPAPGPQSPAPDPREPGYTNVGVRVYRAAALREAILGIRAEHWSAGRGYAIPGNAPGSDPAGGEFALDNVDALLAARGRARLLAMARPQELSPVKSLSDLPRFERDMGVVASDWALAGGLAGRS